MKKLLLFFIILIAVLYSSSTYASFSFAYDIYIKSDKTLDINVRGDPNDESIRIFDNYFTYENDVLTIKENTYICYIKSEVDVTITSNDKPVNIEYINQTSTDVHYKLDKLRINEGQLYVIGSEMSVEAVDSFFNIAYFQMYDWDLLPDNEERLSLNNTTIKNGGLLASYGHTKIVDSDLNIMSIEERANNLTIINSHIKTNNGINNYSISNGGVTTTKIINSNLETDGTNNFILIGNGNSPAGVLEIEDSNIKNFQIENMRSTYFDNNSYTKIKNTKFENLKIIKTYNPLYIYDSNIDVGEIYIMTNDVENNKNGVFFDNSKLNIGTFLVVGKIYINNSYVESDTLQFNRYPMDNEINITDSYIRLNNVNNKPSFTNVNYFTIHNSNLLAETNNDYVLTVERNSYNFKGITFEIDDNLKLIDKDEKEVHVLGVGEFVEEINQYPTYYLAYDGDVTFPKSLKLISQAKVTFKVDNGTWSDGSNNDIEITKDVWTKLSSDEIPVGMIGDTEGSWEIEPNTEDYVKGNITYVYKFKKKGIVKGVIEDLTENPKTGVFRYSFITLLLLCVSILVYRRITINRYFKYK